MSKMDGYLKEAFVDESQANRKYLAFADKAYKDGFAQAVCLLRAAAEMIHVHDHLQTLKRIRSTKEIIEEALRGRNI